MNQNELFDEHGAPDANPTAPDARGNPAAPVPLLADGFTVKVFGMGGVGSIVGRYLYIYLNSVGTAGRLVFVDGDDFEPKNASRMLFATPGNKAAVICEDLHPYTHDSNLELVAIEEYVTEANLERLIAEDDIVILAVDNHATRKLVNDFCATKRRNVCLISGGNDGVEEDESGHELRGTYGNVQIFLRRDGEDAGPSLTTYHPEIEDPADQLPGVSCTELVDSVPQILFTNILTASSIMNAFWLYVSGTLHYSELCFDIEDGLMRPQPYPAPQLGQAQEKPAARTA